MEAYASNGDLVLRFDLPGNILEECTLTVSSVRKSVAEAASRGFWNLRRSAVDLSRSLYGGG